MKYAWFALTLIPWTPLAAQGPQVTIYNDGFAAVKELRNLQLQAGVSEVRVTDMSRQLEPDSVMVREMSATPFGLRILEQSFVNDPLTEGLLLYQLEGETIRFEEKRQDGTIKETSAKLIRSGYVPGAGSTEQPIVEQDGEVRFSLPGQPVFASIDSSAFLKPSLVWRIATQQGGECPVEIGYITGGMSWEATYNLVAPAEGRDEYDLTGWISLHNNTGKNFIDAQLKLIAGDVAKIQPVLKRGLRAQAEMMMAFDDSSMPDQRAFDEFHLYTLPLPVLLRNNELKQVEFLRASGVKGQRYYTYQPLISYRYGGGVVPDPMYGATSDKKVGVRIEISNSATNQLGVPLPKGKLRMYRTDAVDDRREFTGESTMDHLPKNETLKLDMGAAFDLVGERVQTDFSVDTTAKRMTESIRVTLRNRKESPVEIRVVEPLYRGANWKITAQSDEFTKIDANTIEFRIPVPADGESALTYTVYYTW